MSNENRIFGIDLGDTNSCISYVDENGSPVVITDEENDVVTPSVVYFENANNTVVGKWAKQSALVYPDQTVEFIKGWMGKSKEGKPEWEREFFGNTYHPEGVSALILQ